MLKLNTIILVLILTFSYQLSGQSTTTARLTIQSGGSVNFYFNSLYKYENGISYDDILKFNVYFIDTLDIDGSQTAATWKLDVKALDTDIRGISSVLPLSTIELEANHGGGPAANYIPGPLALDSNDISLVTVGTQTDLIIPVLTTVLVSIHCGITTPLLGVTLDHYTVDIIFTLGIE